MAKGVKEPPYTREILRLAASIPYLEPFERLEGATELRSKTCGSRMRMAVELDWADRVVQLRQAGKRTEPKHLGRQLHTVVQLVKLRGASP